MLKDKLISVLWYNRFFYRIGSHSTISSPLFTHQPEFISLGERVSIGPYCRMEAHPDAEQAKLLAPILKIGSRVRIEHGVNISSAIDLEIQDDVLIAGGCYISDNNHSIDPEGPRYLEQPLTREKTTIGRGAWLGQNVCVLAGATIGEKSVIGAGSIVRGNIPPYSIAVGSPARVIKRYSFETKQWEKC